MASEDNLVGGRGEDATKVIMSTYELSRERRIRENLERMRKMGIFDIALKLRTSSGGVRKRSRTTYSSGAARRGSDYGTGGGGGARQFTPLRRSSRLQNATPVTYSDVLLSERARRRPKSNKMVSAVANEHLLLGEGPKAEVYTEEHEKLLGSTEKSWELFADGYGKDGRRIYDPFKGKSCHQCRQKTLGHRTKCSQCSTGQGQFCGDCLYMRYGEHVLEALENPKWICPVCRGICNCSLCRHIKGWAPTGPLYRKISSMGFKSVAHYLIQTRRLQLKSESVPGSPAQLSAKRSLLFSNSGSEEFQESNMEIRLVHIDSNKDENSDLNTDRVSTRNLLINRRLSFMSDGRSTIAEEAQDNQICAKEHSEDQHIVGTNSSISNNSGQAQKSGSCSQPNQSAEQIPDCYRSMEEQKEGHRIVVAAISADASGLRQMKNNGSCSELNQDSIGGRLRLRNRSSLLFLDHNIKTDRDLDYQRGNVQNEGHRAVVAAIFADANRLDQVKNQGYYSKPNQDSMGGRLRLRKKSLCLLSDDSYTETVQALHCQRGNGEHNKDHHIVVAAITAASDNLRDYLIGSEEQHGDHRIVVAAIRAAENSSRPVKCEPCRELNDESVGGRLRSRRRQ
ncbi:hypothetical protein MLD38_003155 [Melastoma candidum]|uniref:Uncharacterized protein n=1 Tax=Melastoma candidum TaxID=119954 RepID=A0ACB9S1T6_9MYRT|nr:hypothetical protein MLD38_003155 [Melastoma candidum]